MSLIRVQISIERPGDPVEVYTGTLLIRSDLFAMEPGRKRDTAIAITMSRISESFTAIYREATKPAEEPPHQP